MPLRPDRPDPQQRRSPFDLRDDWWTLPHDQLAVQLRDIVWPQGMPADQTGPALERLVHHHPRLVPLAMVKGLRPSRWKRTLDDAGEPRTSSGPETSTLLLLLERGDAPMVDQALSHRLELTPPEVQRWPSLALALLTLSREASPDSTVGRLNPAQRLDRERAIVAVLREYEQPGLNGADAGPTLVTAVRQASPDTVLAALVEHGINPQDWYRTGPPRGARLALNELIARGTVGDLDRFLRWGLPLGHGPGDDDAALTVIARAAPRFTSRTPGEAPEETPEGWAQRQVSLLATLERHGWTPGPRFRAEAILTAVRASTDPALLPHLIARGADPFARDALGNTTLHRIGRLLTGLGNLLALLDLGVDPQACNDAGETALDRFREEAQAMDAVALGPHATAIAALENVVLRRSMQALDGPGMIPPAAPRERPRL